MIRNEKKEFSWRESAIIFSDKRSNGRSADFFIAEATVIGLDNEADYYKEHCSILRTVRSRTIRSSLLYSPFVFTWTDSRTFLQIHQINMEWSDCEKLRHEETDEETDYCKEQRIRLGVKFFSSWNLFFSSPPYGTYFGTFNRF